MNASEIRQVYDWQTDLGTESLTFRAEKTSMAFYKTGIADRKPVEKPTHRYVTV
jgi:hypothetical protein